MESKKIYKHRAVIEFYSAEPLDGDYDIKVIADEIDTGSLIGTEELELNIEEVEGKEAIISRLEEIGNDGTFFDVELGFDEEDEEGDDEGDEEGDEV